ncbi:MAG: PqqD family protein [Clostridia bacterium]|nr:PqqD family protein [Clostridia bacterium]
MKNKKENYIEKVPVINQNIGWSKDENGAVTLEIENKGVFNRIAQKLFRKPKISYIHLEEMGSFVWPLIDGKNDIFELGRKAKEHFGEKAEPLYPRLVKYFEILESYKFITFK